MNSQDLIDKLNDCLRHEWTGVAQYAQAGFVVSGLWREVYSGMFFDSTKECFGHAKQIGEKIAALGGVPSIERNPIQQSNDLNEMLQFALGFETAAVKLYTEAIDFAESANDRALVVLLEDILKEEQDGLDELTRIIRQPSAVSSVEGASKVG